MKISRNNDAAAPIDIWLLVFPHFLLLDATGPAQVFSTANDEARDAGRPLPYRIHLIAPGGGAVVSSSGISVLTAALPRRSLAGATLIVAGGRCADLPTDATLLRWIVRASDAVARCCSVCTGAFVLARAGLLDGRRAVTHWKDVAQLRSEHSGVVTQDNEIYVSDGKFHTSAGISAGMDLALSLVEQDLGRATALAVAKRMVFFLKRPGGQRQFSSEMLSHLPEQSVGGQLAAWLRPRLRQEVDVVQMAGACALSVRTLHRRLRQEIGVAPAQLLLRLRMELACGLLNSRE
ncbi:GlxA family transcriptional regulator [Massilia sp. TSP1-1-2]|uniref:GlxA family transcriptional regulator n=1 Tax=Massilia sp. TSP1-1-2 TaxID=2804649 RepID=UPI003CF07217